MGSDSADSVTRMDMVHVWRQMIDFLFHDDYRIIYKLAVLKKQLFYETIIIGYRYFK